jgi:hypothetical protein
MALALFFSLDVVVGLLLVLMGTQLWAEVFSQKLYAVLLVRVTSHSHPDQMNMIWHQAIGRAKESLASGGVEHDFANVRVECVVQPTRAAQGDGHGPVHDGVGLVVFAWQALQVETPISA